MLNIPKSEIYFGPGRKNTFVTQKTDRPIKHLRVDIEHSIEQVVGSITSQSSKKVFVKDVKKSAGRIYIHIKSQEFQV